MSQNEPQFRIAEIEVKKSTLDEKIIGMFRCESDARGKRGPTMLVLAEISSTLYVYEQLLDIINGTVEQTRHLTAAVDADPMARFEKLTERLNTALAQFQQQEPTPIAWNRVNIFVLQLLDGTICLSGVGRLTNLFLQKQADGTARSFDLFGSLEQPAEVDPAKPFAALICGDMKPGDVVLAGTQNFERLRGELQLKERLLTLPPVTAALEIRQELERREIPDDFGAVVIASVALPQLAGIVPPVEAAPNAKDRSTVSIEKMKTAERETQGLLSPAIAPLPAARQSKKFMDLAQGGYKRARELAKKHWQRFTPQPGSKDPLTMTSLRGMNAGHGSFMTRERKLKLLGAACILLLVFGGYAFFRHTQQVKAEQTLWDLTYNQANDKKNQAEADLLYGNEDQARRLLHDANGLLATLDEKTTERKTAKEKMLQDLADLQTKLKREVRVDQPTELASLALGSPDNSLQDITVLKGEIYSVDSSVGSLLQVDPTAGAVKRIALDASSTRVMAITASKDKVLLLTDSRQVLSVDPTKGALTTLKLESTRASSTADLAFYNNRLYVLDPLGNMIWRYSANTAGFGGEQAYLKQNTSNLANAVGLSIDVNVYVAFSDGKLMRYLSGVEETWSPNEIDPPLASANAVWTSPDTDRLIVADPVGKRILVFRKDGQLVAQIVSANFKGPRFVTADVTAKKIYAVDGNRVLQLDLP